VADGSAKKKKKKKKMAVAVARTQDDHQILAGECPGIIEPHWQPVSIFIGIFRIFNSKLSFLIVNCIF
jgi:hypothetical protein